MLYKAGREISMADGAAEVAVKRFPANMINAGKPLALKDPSGTVIHSYTYPKAKAGRSIERGEGDKWHLSSDPRGVHRARKTEARLTSQKSQKYPPVTCLSMK